MESNENHRECEKSGLWPKKTHKDSQRRHKWIKIPEIYRDIDNFRCNLFSIHSRFFDPLQDDSGSDPGSDDGEATVGLLALDNGEVEAYLGKVNSA